VPAGTILPVERNGKPRTKTHSLALEFAALINGWSVKPLSIRLGIVSGWSPLESTDPHSTIHRTDPVHALERSPQWLRAALSRISQDAAHRHGGPCLKGAAQSRLAVPSHRQRRLADSHTYPTLLQVPAFVLQPAARLGSFEPLSRSGCSKRALAGAIHKARRFSDHRSQFQMNV
jgi:hypothetical protein